MVYYSYYLELITFPFLFIDWGQGEHYGWKKVGERIESNNLWVKVESLKALKGRLAAVEKSKAYANNVRDVAITAKELARGA